MKGEKLHSLHTYPEDREWQKVCLHVAVTNWPKLAASNISMANIILTEMSFQIEDNFCLYKRKKTSVKKILSRWESKKTPRYFLHTFLLENKSIGFWQCLVAVCRQCLQHRFKVDILPFSSRQPDTHSSGLPCIISILYTIFM